MEAKLIFLGSGSSAGVPAIGNWWGQCDPTEPRNRRTRPSIAIQTPSTLLVVDTGADFREQMNRENLGCPDAIIYTHYHSDHVAGIDELRMLQRLNKRKFPVYANEATLQKLTTQFDYMFTESSEGFYPPVCDPMPLNIGGTTTIREIEFTSFDLDHGTILSAGLRFGNVAYCTDVKRIDQPAIEALQGVDTLIIDAAGNESETNPVHMSIPETIAANDKIGAQKVILTHLPPTMDYQSLLKRLPKGFEPAYDGMTLPVTLYKQ